ncbi:Alkyl sulfatase BDS1, metallo-beta-lactamase superfamily [Pseudomonas sp. ok272]|uniref:alkyl/aryl-sulfatase n=1 Tax=unclassified Pseudomonas TaxID=196821 RepID=UPI0008C71233|nr:MULTISPECIES: alkyl sulfatase dimerization domain-containing protein [unclassified Pseudomonas]SEN59020.1 Alkyl sulfatase BDS1, metallo-beta-lactamase superfamily [Pseudomonas sp. ok272]SFN37428.1 Alkyl sulfatase BDS1, metallo-beta-lactamase superfamily [Pseudomonas sp. ok602]
MPRFTLSSRGLLAALITACLAQSVSAAQAPVAASPLTAASNAAVLKQLPFSDRTDYESVDRGLIAPFSGQIKTADGKVIWDTSSYRFLDKDQAPDTVNPSLWRLAQLSTHAGLFEVSPKIYQVRGLDLANMTIIEGDDGLIIVDPLTMAETAKTALDLYYQNRARKPVVAVIYTHTHVDHFGGVRGVIDEADVKAGKVKVYAPAGFMEHVMSENVYAGNAMSRRAQFQFGSLLPRGDKGQVDAGMGKTVPSGGTITLIEPTDLISQAQETRTIAGLEFEFQLTSGTEAPAEMNFYLPQLRALCMAENATQMMHNLLTPRGAEVRDAKAWSHYLDSSLTQYGAKTDVLFAQHNWPTWGGERIRTLLADQRDMYAFLNDRTLHLLNQGMTPMEIAQNMQKLPGELENKWYTRSYYGSLSHNSRAVYQRYMGFYDGNPANLNPLPPVETAKHYVDAIGGTQAVLGKMREAMTKGDYRWAAQLGNQLVFAEPDNAEGREAQARALEQLGYQSENATWRNMYLTGAMELRNGVPNNTGSSVSVDMVRAMTPDMFFDYLAIRLDSEKAVGHDLTLNWIFESPEQAYNLTLRNGVLTHRAGNNPQADASVRMSKSTLEQISLKQVDFPTALQKGLIKLEGNGKKLGELLTSLDTFSPQFNIVTP